ncbi:hypothetical protein [Sphaerospermopsis reniformis]|uniref:hypothetical protein n=1 Tax=Sphaerospermopsis reniformis TaxID=531300 RepID=UPI0010F4F4D3|nr:hypothetical protein [Sphaerospermopsis reniformis]
MTIYMDSCCFCRLLDDPIQYRVRLETEAVVSILEYCDRGDLVLVNSDALEFELQKIPDSGNRDQILAFLGAANIFVESNEDISCCAFNLYKVNRQDACSTRLKNIKIIQFSCITA